LDFAVPQYIVAAMKRLTRQILFLLFFISGFCGLVYQVVWTRMAFASFGVITPVLSVVLSVFMLGLSAGSWASGRSIGYLVNRTGRSAAWFYAGAELLIGVGAFAVPRLFSWGEFLLLTSGQTDSFRYLLLSAVVLAISLAPWCFFMGATFPFMMAFVRESDSGNRESFSYLYLANVLGAMAGSLLTAVMLVEMLGFRHTLWVAAIGNFTVAGISFLLGLNRSLPAGDSSLPPGTGSEQSSPSEGGNPGGPPVRALLFLTGFSAMAMEVVWTRAFMPVLKTQVYSFAMIVFTYLGATFLGSLFYRHHLRRKSRYSTPQLISFLIVAAFVPIVLNDPRVLQWGVLHLFTHAAPVFVLLSICPLCAILGYLTPSLIDEYSAGRPADAGKAYALNVLGCILGPLVASYGLVPWIGERYTLVLLGLPFLAFWAVSGRSLARFSRWVPGLAAGAAVVWSAFFAEDFEGTMLRTAPNCSVRRDYAASVISFGTGLDKLLLVNGVGMTILSPVTKFMVHLPLLLHRDPPQSALIICFGMGTTYRSALSWGIDTTAVELVPSVPKAFGFYHADAAQVLLNPRGGITIDDGRRFLKRTTKKFDVIVIDPPPPPETAGSSLLYSEEFYALAKQRLNPHGILQAWCPRGEVLTFQAVLRSIHNSFPCVRCFESVEGWGIHLLASMDPIETRPAQELIARMPAMARKDLLEWTPSEDLTAYVQQVLSQEDPVQIMLNTNSNVRITDDHPYNEYFLLRRHNLP